MKLLAENHEAVETILKIGTTRPRISDDANRIASRLGIMRYLCIADQVRRYCRRGTRLLDLGGGFGKVSFFLKNWGYEVTVFEVKPHYEEVLKRLRIPYSIQQDGDLSIYPDVFLGGLFEAAVLELIEDIRTFIRNVRRILYDGGLYFCGVFPNKKYWLTKMGLSGHSPYTNLRSYGLSDVVSILRQEGFTVLTTEQFQFFPMNLPKINHMVSVLWSLDRMLCRLPYIGRLRNNFNFVLKRL